MCTLGTAFSDINGHHTLHVFKQCDQIEKAEFIIPKVETSKKGIRYVAFKRKQKNGKIPTWTGINEYGVCFVAGDSYLKKSIDFLCAGTCGNISVFDMYHNTITDFKTAAEAAQFAKKFYESITGVNFTDIIQISDANEMYFIETVSACVKMIRRTSGTFASTNHCRMFYDAIDYEQNHSTYLRLQRAEQILQTQPDYLGVGNVLRDSYYGKTVWSVCRYAGMGDDNAASTSSDEKLYYTQGAVIFSIIPNTDDKPMIYCDYVINGNAADNEGYSWRPFMDKSEPVPVNRIGTKDCLIFKDNIQ